MYPTLYNWIVFQIVYNNNYLLIPKMDYITMILLLK